MLARPKRKPRQQFSRPSISVRGEKSFVSDISPGDTVRMATWPAGEFQRVRSVSHGHAYAVITWEEPDPLTGLLETTHIPQAPIERL